MTQRTTTRLVLTAVASAVAVAGLLAQSATAPLMNIKMGLWETTTTTQMTMMGQSMPAQAPHTMKVCMTPKKLQTGTFDAPDPKSGMSCTREITGQTATSTDIKMACTIDKMPGSTLNGTGHYDVVAPDHVTSKSTMSMTGQMAMTMNMTAEMKFVAADCGDVK